MHNKHYYKSVLVLGNGDYSLRVADEIASLGCPVTVAMSSRTVRQTSYANDANRRLWSPAKFLDFSGQAGNFRAVFDANNGATKEGLFGCVVIALECLWIPSLNKWGMEERKGVIGLSQFLQHFDSYAAEITSKDKVVFVCGFKHNSWPITQEQIGKKAISLREKTGAAVYVLTEHFKVAAKGMERLIRNARESGVVFVKFSKGSPEIIAHEDGVRIKYFDEALGSAVQMTAKLVVIEDEACPPSEASLVARFMEINTDRKGFLQGDLIFNFPILTNRTGIFVVGSGKGPISDEQAETEIKCVTSEVAKLFSYFDAAPEVPLARLDERKCGQCLTCLRICPHRAVSVYSEKAKPQISAVACRGCGICVAACPMKAIELEEYTREMVFPELDRISEILAAEASNSQPKLLVLACQHSAYDAYLLAKEKGISIPEGVEVHRVPCGGRVDLEQIMRPLLAGVDGVMVLACHHDSCKSVYGSGTCEGRVRIMQGMLEQVGVDKTRLLFGTMAPGSGAEFVALIDDFRNYLTAIVSRAPVTSIRA